MHVWYVDKEMEQNSRQGEVTAIGFVLFCQFHCFSRQNLPIFSSIIRQGLVYALCMLLLQNHAVNSWPWSSQMFRKWIPHLQAALSCDAIRVECCAKRLISDAQKKELMAIKNSAKHNERLLDMLSRGTAETFHTFCTIVRSTEPKANFSKFLDDMQSVDTFVGGK